MKPDCCNQRAMKNLYLLHDGFQDFQFQGGIMANFWEDLQTQRWDDHRYYHQSRINQTLHFVSALSFLVAYGMLFEDPAMAALIGWLVSMVTRQSGHYFFEPRGYDAINNATHEYKEDVKVGYNLRRKTVLLVIWALVPVVMWLDPHFFGIAGILFRTVHLFFLKDVRTGLVWITKIITDPFNDVRTYWKSPYYLMRGELMDPMRHVEEQSA
jgi:hypothetical protein